MKIETIEKVLKKARIKYEIVNDSMVQSKLLINKKLRTLIIYTKPQYDILINENGIMLMLLAKDKNDKNIYEVLEFNIEKCSSKDFLCKIKDCIGFIEGTYRLMERGFKICAKRYKEYTQDKIDEYKYGKPKVRSQYLN